MNLRFPRPRHAALRSAPSQRPCTARTPSGVAGRVTGEGAGGRRRSQPFGSLRLRETGVGGQVAPCPPRPCEAEPQLFLASASTLLNSVIAVTCRRRGGSRAALRRRRAGRSSACVVRHLLDSRMNSAIRVAAALDFSPGGRASRPGSRDREPSSTPALARGPLSPGPLDDYAS